MSRLLRGAVLGTAILLTAAACTSAGAEGNGAKDSGPAPADDVGEGHGDLYYVVYEDQGDESISKLLRWDGTEDGEVETVAQTADTRLFHTATISSDGAFAVYAEGYEDGTLKLMDLASGDTESFLDFPRLGDSCSTPAFIPGGHELLVPDADGVTVHDPVESAVGDTFTVGSCMPMPAVAEGDEEPSIFYLDSDTGVDSGEIMFMKPDREVVDTDLGAKAAKFLDTTLLHEIGAVSPTGSQLCVDSFRSEASGMDPYSRHANCQVLIDVATGEHLKHFDGETFAVRYTGDGLVLSKDGELSYYPKADNLDTPATTVPEPEELAGAQLIAAIDA